jgi:hypothetical protein
VLIGGILPPGGMELIQFFRFTENADILSAFPGADGCEAKVPNHLLVLIGGILPPGGMELIQFSRFTENADILSAFPWGG